MSRGDEPLYGGRKETEKTRVEVVEITPPITVREHFASLAMQGLLGSVSGHVEFDKVAKDAIDFADALLAELGKTDEQK